MVNLDRCIEGARDRTMLVGAQARDLMHLRLGDPKHFLRTTSDVDLALAVANSDDYANLTASFEARKSSSDVKYLIGGLPVDLIPFGGIEQPMGCAKPSPDSDPLSVLAYTSAFAAADEYVLPDGRRIKVVDPLHYTALKLDAWVDRSSYGEYKDASDIRVVFDWFRQHSQYIDDAYVGDPSPAERNGWDQALACLWILGSNVAHAIGEANTKAIAAKWGQSHRESLGKHLGKPWDSLGDLASGHGEVKAFADGLEV
ncbi:hypothetical protein ACFUOZ_12485 [Paenarthrobacter sp. NPDC057355]|uniref:hypothetical protein n=1 Tax=Paenarthrobacter sp. NPDC057355 TaxID=3346105 RepID=UPI00362F30CE